VSTLLAIEVSPRFEYSVSRRLTSNFVERWKAAHPDGLVVYRDLAKTNLPWIDLSWIGGSFSPPEQQTSEMRAAIAISDDLVEELKSADAIVIGTPMYNLSIPAILKAYIDHIVRIGLTLSPTYEGLVTGKKATVILVSGTNFAPGSQYESFNMASSYLKLILGLIGITDVNVILAGGTRQIDRGEKPLTEFSAPIESEIAALFRA
jgi:FMN-dependent NADH-azoreductase